MALEQIEKYIEIEAPAERYLCERPEISWRYLSNGLVPTLLDVTFINVQTNATIVFRDIEGDCQPFVPPSPLPEGVYDIRLSSARSVKLISPNLRVGIVADHALQDVLNRYKAKDTVVRPVPIGIAPQGIVSLMGQEQFCFEWQVDLTDILSFSVQLVDGGSGRLVKKWTGLTPESTKLHLDMSEACALAGQDLKWFVTAVYLEENALSERLPLRVEVSEEQKQKSSPESKGPVVEMVRLNEVGVVFNKTSRLEKDKLKGLFKELFAKGSKREQFWALKNISFTLNKGDVLGVIGNNGAGKSTLLKILTGVLCPDQGIIQSQGRVSALLALGAGFMTDLSGRENIYLSGAYLGLPKKTIAGLYDRIVEFSELESFIDTQVRYYSSGMKARLGFSVAVHLDPEILVVDEVLAAGDKEFRQKAELKMKEFMFKAKVLIIASHNMNFIANISNKCILLEKGRIKAYGPTDEVLAAY